MAERAFATIGYMDEQKKFIQQDIRARDVYAVSGQSMEEHVTSADIHLTSEQATLIANAIQQALLGAPNGVATLGTDGHIPASQLDLGKYATSANVATYDDMLALTASQAKINTFVFVADATGDPTVEEGWASYKRVATNGDASDYIKVAEGESLDISFPEMEQGIAAAQSTADAAVTAAAAADGKAATAQNAADAAAQAASAAQGTADGAVSAAGTAQAAAEAAQGTADAAALEAAKLDFAYCTDEEDMASKNLRVGAVVLMAVTND